jgi:ornithine cyclodeaminase/alanine dehydrogenase-like protein (mu-crystallin family)
MSAPDSVLFIDYATTVKLLPVPDAMAICEDVFRMHARNSVKWSVPPSQRLDVGAPFHNHWHVKTVILEDEPIAGVRLYSYYDDGLRNTVGRLDCARYIVLADPRTGQPIAILDEHWTYAIRSAAAAMVALKWLGPRTPRTLGLIGVGTMGENCLRCLRHLYRFEEIICTSRRADTREAFAAKWSSCSASRCGRSTASRRSCATPISPSAAPRGPISSAASRGCSPGRLSFRWRAAKWTRRAGRGSTRS